MPRYPRPEVPARWLPWLASFDLALASLPRSKRTRETYADGVSWFVATLPDDVDDWSDVTHLHLRGFFAHLAEIGYAQSYINNIGRCIQAFDKWYSIEEEVPRVFGDKLKVPAPPKLGHNPPPVIATEQLTALLRDAEAGRSFEDRRDAAMLRLFAETGCRLAEIANLGLADVNLAAREATVTGKGAKTRTVRYGPKAAQAIDRYIRMRAKHRHAHLAALWVGVRRAQGMTPSGVYQVIQRRGRRLGLEIHPHLFRHTFSHRWLDAGGAEGDLMELNGWDSPQMLRHYGASARGARARRAYDRVDVMGGA